MYLNFPRNTEEVFNYYKSIFGGEFIGGVARFGDMPAHEGVPPMSDADKNLVMYIALPILGRHVIMGTDAPEAMGFKVSMGNNICINLEPDTREETEKLFSALSQNGTIEMALTYIPWNAYFGSCNDKYGVQWMFNFNQKI